VGRKEEGHFIARNVKHVGQKRREARGDRRGGGKVQYRELSGKKGGGSCEEGDRGLDRRVSGSGVVEVKKKVQAGMSIHIGLKKSTGRTQGGGDRGMDGEG